jgi:hypothetical protein
VFVRFLGASPEHGQCCLLQLIDHRHGRSLLLRQIAWRAREATFVGARSRCLFQLIDYRHGRLLLLRVLRFRTSYATYLLISPNHGICIWREENVLDRCLFRLRLHARDDDGHCYMEYFQIASFSIGVLFF